MLINQKWYKNFMSIALTVTKSFFRENNILKYKKNSLLNSQFISELIVNY